MLAENCSCPASTMLMSISSMAAKNWMLFNSTTPAAKTKSFVESLSRQKKLQKESGFKELIDPATPDNPVFLSRYDLHSALANSAALRLASITSHTPDPPGGVIVRDAQGNPTGDLKDAA